MNPNLMSFTKPRITYFGVPGRAETTRLMLEEAGVDYEYISTTLADWPNQKPAFADVLPFGQLPLYQDNDISLVQSQAIMRYLAKKHGFAGSNAIETAKIDSFSEDCEEILYLAILVKYNSTEEAKAEALKIILDKLPARLVVYENILKNNDPGFLVGSKISSADFHFFFVLKTLDFVSKDLGAIIDTFSHVKAFSERIVSREKIKAYYDKKPYGAYYETK